MEAFDGLMDDMKRDLVPFSEKGAGLLVGLAAGKLAADFVADYLAPLTKKDPTDPTGVKVVALTGTELQTAMDSVSRKYLAPLIPIALGLAANSFGASKGYPQAGESVGLGLAAYGIGRLLANVVGVHVTKSDGTVATDASGQPELTFVGKYLPIAPPSGLAGLGHAHLLSQFAGLGAGRVNPAGVEEYLARLQNRPVGSGPLTSKPAPQFGAGPIMSRPVAAPARKLSMAVRTA